MRTLPHWGHLLPLLGATLAHYFGLGWLKLARREANRGECGLPAKPALKRIDKRDYATLPTDDDATEWCPIHETWFEGIDGFPDRSECPACLDEWYASFASGDEPADGEDWDLDDRAELGPDPRHSDGWYRDLARRAEFGRDGSDPYRPEGGF